MVTLVNRAKMTIVSTGTGTLTLGTAVDGFQNFGAAGVADGDMVRYVIEEGTAWEIGTGIYAAAGPSLTRSPSESSAGGARIPLSGAAVVFITATTSDIIQPGDNITKLANDAGYTANPGTVTSVAAAAGAGISVSGAPVTSAGTLTITNTAPHQPTNLGLTGTGNSRTLTSSTGSNVTLPVATPTNAGLMVTGDKTKLDGIAAGAQVNVGTDLGITGAGDTRTITSSTGSNTTLPTATTSTAGLMATGDKSKLDSIAAGAQVNVGTNLAMGGSGNSRTITSSTGNNVSVPVASTSNAGFMATGDKSKLDGIAAGAQVNVGTNLGSSGTGATRTITSSTGSNTSITFSAADVGAFPANNIPSGTKMLFVQTSAPTGWTKDTTHNNKALRVVTGTAGSGGNIHFTSAFANRTVSDTAAGGSVHHHTLSWHEMPAHHHLVDHAQALATFGTEGSRWYHRVHGTYVAASHQPDRRAPL